MMNNNAIDNLMKAVELEYNLKQLTPRIEMTLSINEAYMDFIDKKYEDKLRDLQLVENVRSKMTELLVMITSVKDIEHQAIVIKDMELMWKCEAKIAKMINQMELLRDKYDL